MLQKDEAGGVSEKTCNCAEGSRSGDKDARSEMCILDGRKGERNVAAASKQMRQTCYC